LLLIPSDDLLLW
jgi:hypothetical protein